MNISAEDATVIGVERDDPGTADATEGHHTLQEWILMGLERTFASEDEESEYFGRIPVPGEELTTVTAEPSSSESVHEPERIRWAPVTPQSRTSQPEAPSEPEGANESVEEPERIRWAPATPESRTKQPEAAAEPDAASEALPAEAPVTIRWRSGA